MNLLLKAFINGPLLLLAALMGIVGVFAGLFWGVLHHPAITLGAAGGTIVFAMVVSSWADAYADLKKKPGERRGLWD